MSNPLAELRRLLSATSPAESCVVVSTNPVVVSSGSGSRQVLSTISVAVGDCVLVKDGSVQGKIPRQEDLPHYHL